MMRKSALIGVGILLSSTLFLVFHSCDSRNSLNRSRPTASFAADMTIVRDYSQQRSVARASFRRNSEPFDEGIITLGSDTIAFAGNGSYFSQSPGLELPPGINQITFASQEDEYFKTVTIELPDSFGVTNVFPRDNPNAQEVLLNWSLPGGATRFLLVVVSRGYPLDTTIPHMVILNSNITSAVVPDSTFEDPFGFIVDDIYYVYMVAFNQGFGEYDGIPFPLPPGLPERRISEPAGFLRYGTVAPVDSIIVLP